MKRHLCRHLCRIIAACLLACLLAPAAVAAPVAEFDRDGCLAMLTEPEDGVVPLTFCRGEDPLKAEEIPWQDGYAGKGVLLDGDGAYFRTDSALLAQESLSVSLWVNWQDAAAAPSDAVLWALCSDDRDTQTVMLFPCHEEYGLLLQVQYSTAVRRLYRPEAEGAGLTAGWHFITVTWQAQAMRLYVDGELWAEETDIISPARFAPRQLVLGGDIRTEHTGYFHGLVDEVRLYDQAMDADRIAALAAEEPAPPATTVPTQPAVEPALVPEDPLQLQNRQWLLIVPLVAVVGLAFTATPRRKRK